ncbi:MAG: hypothetical protein L6Q71_00455 [Planctomycetes bacterium]|nr:hypothetical protein [Planctomycetota bacterium]NUQ34351.1 hypothetical protein [Planctomycetaceae bacterium]
MKTGMFFGGAFVLVAMLTFALNVPRYQASEEPELIRTSDTDGADAPSGGLILRVPAAGPVNDTHVPTTEGAEPPAEPSEPGIEDAGEPAPPFFNEPIAGKCIFIIDVSLSMNNSDVGGGEDYDGNVVANMSRLMCVKTELINFIKQVEPGFFFDIVWLAGATNVVPNTDVWKGELTECTDEIRAEAIETVKAQTTWWGTPTWRALQRACLDYDDDLSVLVFLTDGTPFPFGAGEWGGESHVNSIHKDFPVWFAGKKANGCKLIGVHVGKNPNAGSFMQDWCSFNGASYTHK